MDSSLRGLARELASSAPCSVEMPAGTGKTHLLAAAVAVEAAAGERSLVLTHTNAGVDAIRKRLRTFGVPQAAFHVDTITGWAFSLVRAYSQISGIRVPDDPDWTLSDTYIEGAQKAAHSRAVMAVHRQSFGYLFVDEYQDCTLEQDAFIKQISVSIPQTVVLGDRLQAIFGFAGALVNWQDHVVPALPAFVVEWKPHRWIGHNSDLGDWLLRIRPSLFAGGTIDFTSFDVEGLRLVARSTPRDLSAAAYRLRDQADSVVLLDKWPNTVAQHASHLRNYTVMEDIQGSFMRAWVERLPSSDDPLLAAWLAKFSKKCAAGLGGLDQALIGRLNRNQSIGSLRRQGLESVITALEELRVAPSYQGVVTAANAIRNAPSVRLYRREAWNDTLEAVSLCESTEKAPVEHLAQIRDRLRHGGRRTPNRIVSRTVLVKGLEFDHVVIANLANFSDAQNLYVALTRARKSITILGDHHNLTLGDG